MPIRLSYIVASISINNNWKHQYFEILGFANVFLYKSRFKWLSSWIWNLMKNIIIISKAVFKYLACIWKFWVKSIVYKDNFLWVPSLTKTCITMLLHRPSNTKPKTLLPSMQKRAQQLTTASSIPLSLILVWQWPSKKSPNDLSRQTGQNRTQGCPLTC